MQTATAHTRRITGLDYRVWLTMMACWLLCAGFLLYRQINLSGGQPCVQGFIVVDSREEDAVAVCDPDRYAIFKVPVPPGTRVEWTFNDGTETVVGPAAQQHKFTGIGNYRVVATVNGGCEYVKEVVVKSPLEIERPAAEVKIYPDTMKSAPGMPIGFSAVVNFPVKSYEWNILGTDISKTGERVEFSFPAARKYTVQVVVNGNPATAASKVIDIVSADLPPFQTPTGPSPIPDMSGLGPLVKNEGDTKKQPAQTGMGSADNNPPKDSVKSNAPSSTALEIDPETFKGLLQGVLNDDKLPAAKLNSYLDYKESTKVSVNGAEEPISLDAFCHAYRKRKIETLGFQRDNYKSIQKINLKVKKTFFEKLNPFKKG